MALKVLTDLDSARTQYYHFKAIIIAGMGLFTDAYDLFCIPPIMKLIGRIYYRSSTDSNNLYEVPRAVTSAMVVTALLGTVIGQLVFGRLGDLIGRRKVYGFALMIMVLSSFGCGHSICTSRTCVLLSLGFFRFLLGIGIGGDYPLSATIMSEFANRKTRGAFIAGVFSMQGFGILASSTVTMIVCSIFNRANGGSEVQPHGADLAWRLILMIGAIPAGLTYYWRMMMPETARYALHLNLYDTLSLCLSHSLCFIFFNDRYTALVERNVPQAARDMEKVLDISASQIVEEFSTYLPNSPSSNYSLFSKTFIHSHGLDLFACSISWFLVDIVFYSSNLFQSQIYKRYLSNNHNVNAFQEAFEVAKIQAIIAICSTIPGYFATMYFIDRIGRVKIQIMGFFFMAISLLAIGIPYYSYWNNNTNIGFMFLYGLTFFFSNFGPNTTTFIVPAELFPARFRTTCHGISGAVGKLGAIIGSIGFLWASHNKKDGYNEGIGMTASLLLLAGVCVVGMITTYFFTSETMGKSLEENENIGINEDHQNEIVGDRA
ncbi:hypothetical protein R3W88_013420 [Solanum pinnatisectum]|uniref:Major facilitator superfamily (MFS) profile domain-containing protein n=1 Tax=Solanum pinnatisectum TaxID=50273 RepID=A0AAV9LBW3_9SOLN|nr:hypothetical protein R3W88_013420 [Solanum pinnatisectum]